MAKKTYAARGLIDYITTIDVAGVKLRLIFSGGSMGSNGVIPAKYTTDNAAVQKIIEKSDQYGRGVIYLHSSRP